MFSFLNKKKKSTNVYIFQKEGLEFMYKPIINSIINILKKIYYLNNEIKIYFKVNLTKMKMTFIEKEDILIYVGNVDIPNFKYLKQKKIYTIFYNTEPDINIYESNEIWTYSKYAFNLYKKHNKHQIIRFIPIILEEKIPFVPYNLINTNLKLSFIGNFNYRAPFKKIVLMNDNLIKKNLEEIYNLWNDIDFNHYIISQPRIYLNIIKSELPCLPTVRINKLLSHKCIIISEHTNKIDEEIYRDMVYFCYIDEIPNIFHSLLKKTNIDLIKEADIKYHLFNEKFNIKYIKNQILYK